MKALALLLLFLWVALGAGQTLLGRLGVLKAPPLERAVFSAAFGLGLAAYGVFALGLVGLLSFWPVTLWWIVLALIGFGGMRANVQDIRGIGRQVSGVGENALEDGTAAEIQNPKSKIQSPDTLSRFLPLFGLVTVCLCGLIALIACFQPPTGREWDALAYHLADVKVFLQNRRITSLPTEHHSNFPFTMEMLFAVGLLYDDYPLANLFHFATAGLTVLAMLAFCRRVLSEAVGWIAAILYVTTPIIVWEASTAYIDIGFGLYATLAVFAALTAVNQPEGDTKAGQAWTLLSGLMMGFALGTKYLALLPFGVVAAYLLLKRAPIRTVALYAGLALAIGSPWYIKNVVLTGNPVYPFFYKAFPNSRYWSADRAAPYQAEQDHFGYPHSLKQPADSLRSLLQMPWNLMANADKYANAGDYTFSVLIGGLYAAFCLSLAFTRRIPRLVADLFLIAGTQLVAWFFLAQIGRYLVSMLPMFAVVAAYAASRLLGVSGVECRASGKTSTDVEETGADKIQLPTSNIQKTDTMLLASRGLTLLLLLGQAALLLWSVFIVPTSDRKAEELGMLPTAVSVPEDLPLVTQADSRKEFLERRLDIYPAIEWINTNAPKNAGVLLYEETKGFYLNRPYLWANWEHSSYIPYEKMRDSKEFTAWLRKNGIEYVLINLRASPQNYDPTLALPQPEGPVGHEAEAIQRWYIDTNAPVGTWRHVLGNAIKSGWTVQFSERGIVVLKIEG